MSRTFNVIRNIKYAVIGQIVGILINLISRKVFVMFLPVEYLGLNGLFSNILSMLSLAELGIGTAIIYSLYKPLAEHNIQEIKSLMQLYKKVYCTIGMIIIIAGCSLTPYLHLLIKDAPDISNIKLIYIIFVLNNAVSYFFTYKRSMIIADQKRYIITSYHYILMLLLNIEQIVALYFTQNFIIYLLLQATNTLIENYLLSRKADKLYPYIKEIDVLPLREEVKIEIKKNVFAMIFHRIGGVVVFATDNILISKIIGLTSVGVYSNYVLIKQAVNTIISQIFQSVSASFANLGVIGTNEHKLEIFYVMNFVGAWLFGFCSICIFNLVNPFIQLWLGEMYLFSKSVVFWIVLAFYITGMRQACLVARDVMGLFWYDRYKPIAEIVINIVVSIILGRRFGVAGILAGTVISTITTCFWIEPYILYKYGFHCTVLPYFIKYMGYSLTTLFVAIITSTLCGFMPAYGVYVFVIKFIVCGVVANILFALCYVNTKEFQFVTSIVKKSIARRMFCK